METVLLFASGVASGLCLYWAARCVDPIERDAILRHMAKDWIGRVLEVDKMPTEPRRPSRYAPTFGQSYKPRP